MRRFVSGHNNRRNSTFIAEKFCLIDPTHKTALNEKGKEHWYHYKNGYLCYKCAQKIIFHPKYKDKDRKRIRFRNTRPRLE